MINMRKIYLKTAFCILLSSSAGHVFSVSADDYEARRNLLGKGFDEQNIRIEKNLKDWNRLIAIEAAANRTTNNNTDYLRCAVSARSRDLLQPSCEALARTLLDDLKTAREAISKNETSSEANTIFSLAIQQVERRDKAILRQTTEILEEQITLSPSLAQCDDFKSLVPTETASDYISAVSGHKFSSALRLSAKTRRLYTVGRIVTTACPTFETSTQMSQIKAATISIAFAEAMFEPRLLAASACLRTESVARPNAEALATLCSDVLFGISESDITDFNDWLGKFSVSLQTATCAQWLDSQFGSDPTPLDTLRYSGLVRRLGSTPCEFPAVPASFDSTHLQQAQLQFVVDSILGLAGDGSNK